MSMPAVRHRIWTLEEVERLIDEREGYTPRYELVGGELLVTPGPSWSHQRIVLELMVRLRSYLEPRGIGEVLFGPGEVKLHTGEYYEPDVFVVPLIEGRRPTKPSPEVRPLLICEVLSPGSLRHDRITKRRAFQREAIPEYWIVDGGTEAFEVWHPDDERPAIVDERLEWRPVGATEGFTLDVREFFSSLAP